MVTYEENHKSTLFCKLLKPLIVRGLAVACEKVDNLEI